MKSIYDIIVKLTEFWHSKGCARILPYDFPIGAATFHPECFFNILKQQEFAICFPQSTTRKADGRYGESNIRFLTHTQFQVLIFPAAHNIIDLYQESLEYIGLHPQKNQIQFVVNDWESPTMGGFGKGWEILCNKMEITQFTYFYRMGDIDLLEPSVELAYGIERIAFFVLEKPLLESKWDGMLNYNKKREQELSTYFLQKNQVNIERDFNIIYSRALQLEEPYAIYQVFLEMNDLFNSADALGNISIVLRKSYTDKIRRVANYCAKKYTDNLAGKMGIEPMTFGFGDQRSTN
jgi:glycyl-tRNA synthetase alpha chain